MNTKTKLIAIGVGALVLFTTIGASSMHKTFEYRVLSRQLSSPQDTLNAAGKEGWELIAVVPAATSTSNEETYYLKREVR